MNIIGICQLLTFPALLILIGIITRSPGNYIGPDNPTSIGVIELEEFSQQPKRDPNRTIAPPPRGGSGVPRR